MIEMSLLITIGAAVAGGAVLGHLPGIWSWATSKLSAGEAEVNKVATIAGNTFHTLEGTAANFLAHPITTVENMEHAAVRRMAETAGGAVQALLDESGLDKKIAQLQAVKSAMAAARAEIKAKL